MATVSSLQVNQGGQGSVAGLLQREAESGIHGLGWGWGCTQALPLEAEGSGLRAGVITVKTREAGT